MIVPFSILYLILPLAVSFVSPGLAVRGFVLARLFPAAHLASLNRPGDLREFKQNFLIQIYILFLQNDENYVIINLNFDHQN